MQETWVRFLGREDPLEKEMATHSSILAWRIPWMEELGELQSTRSQRVGHDWANCITLHCITRRLRKEVYPIRRCYQSINYICQHCFQNIETWTLQQYGITSILPHSSKDHYLSSGLLPWLSDLSLWWCLCQLSPQHTECILNILDHMMLNLQWDPITHVLQIFHWHYMCFICCDFIKVKWYK